MTNTPFKKKKISEYNMEDIKEFFYNLSQKISSKIIEGIIMMMKNVMM